MKNKIIYLVLAISIVLVLTGASCTVNQNINQQRNEITNNSPVNEITNQPVNQITNEPSAPTAPETTYTLLDVARHNLETDCWMIINDKVYNVTSYISVHPGGSGLIKDCGQDATTVFNAKPAHQTEKAIRDLNNLIVGSLKK